MILDPNALSAFVDGDAGVGEVLRRQARATCEARPESRPPRFAVLAVTDETAIVYAALRAALGHRLRVLSRDQRFDVVPGLQRKSL
jgi:predicted nucleic acid-binding protein